MKIKYHAFQQRAVDGLRAKTKEAIESYVRTQEYQVISFTAPTGAGKTLIMAGLIESILCGTDEISPQPDAVFVWLSDSPELNAQSKNKIDLKADRIRLDQTVIIEDESFDQEMFDDGHIYFLNTQKLGRSSNLTRNSDSRQYTIWQTLSNTVGRKANRFYFIIDEAHRGAQGNDASKATSIMQRFIKGSPEHGISPMPVVIGMSATVQRFNALVEGSAATVRKIIVTPDEVRESGLLKDTIIVKYPESESGQQEISVLQAAAEEWKDKCDHWGQYCTEQHYAQVHPIFLIQVQNGTAGNLTDTPLDECLKAIKERLSMTFSEGEVVHAFGGTNSSIAVDGLTVPYCEPSKISDNHRIKIVFFKESLSTGWDCPRAETMMSFRRAVDATYIAQLLGRMVRTPTNSRINVDDSLNEVKLYLPFFNREAVKSVVDALSSIEGGAIPTSIYGESIEEPHTEVLSVRRNSVPPLDVSRSNDSQGQSNQQPSNVSTPTDTPRPNSDDLLLDFGDLFSNETSPNPQTTEDVRSVQDHQEPPAIEAAEREDEPQQEEISIQLVAEPEQEVDRQAILEFINSMNITTQRVRRVAINDYLSSLFQLARLLVMSGIDRDCVEKVHTEIVQMIRDYIENLKATFVYEGLVADVESFKLEGQVFDAFGAHIRAEQKETTASSDEDIDRAFRQAEIKLKREGVGLRYRDMYFDANNPNLASIDFILFVNDASCWERLTSYARRKFQSLADGARPSICTARDQRLRDKYNEIISNSDVVTNQILTLPMDVAFPSDPDGDVYDNHLYAKADGKVKIKLNGWERPVIEEESRRDDFVCWLRNASRKYWSLTIAYRMSGETKTMYPDFVIVRRGPNGGYLLDILEPHGDQYEDNLPKAQALAKYAADCNLSFARIQMIRKVPTHGGNSRLVRLDLTKLAVQEQVLRAINGQELDHIFETDGE